MLRKLFAPQMLQERDRASIASISVTSDIGFENAELKPSNKSEAQCITIGHLAIEDRCISTMDEFAPDHEQLLLAMQ